MNVRSFLTSLERAREGFLPPPFFLSLVHSIFLAFGIANLPYSKKVITMSNTLEFTLPELDDLDGLTITKILVAVGDVIHLDQDILSLESEKTVLDVPSTHAGTVTKLSVAVGDKIAQGAIILTLEVSEGAEAVSTSEPE